MKPVNTKIKNKLIKVEAIKNKIAKLRDSLRDAVDDLKEVLEDLDSSIYDFECGQELIENALETMSQNL